jgi:putative intracellular protease/amidase
MPAWNGIDRGVVVDRRLISRREPDDIEVFNHELMRAASSGHDRRHEWGTKSDARSLFFH